jgi:uncharacterized RDD family membrane protein YckC
MTDPTSPYTGQSAPPGQAPAVPQAEIRAASGPSGPRAGFWQRVGQLLIDILILLVPEIILILAINQTAGQLLGFLVQIAYFTYFVGSPAGQTLGMRALGIRVIDMNTGGPIGYGRGLVRSLVQLILSGLIFGLGYLWMLWDREKQCWHDKAASTVVVPVSAYPVQ